MLVHDCSADERWQVATETTILAEDNFKLEILIF